MGPMQPEDQGRDKLSGLFEAYRESCPDPEVSVNFTPQLWQRIEARRTETTSIFKRLAQVCVATTAVLVLLLTTMFSPATDDELVFASTYADVLAADHAEAAFIQALPADLPGESKQ